MASERHENPNLNRVEVELVGGLGNQLFGYYFGKYLAPFIDAPIKALENYSDPIEREKLQAQKEIADKQLQIAQENKNRFDNKNNKK
jgi:hypothetical protein